MQIRIDRDAWIAGFHAGEAGRGVMACPYAAGSCEAYSWMSGRVEGDAKRQGFEYSLGAPAI